MYLSLWATGCTSMEAAISFKVGRMERREGRRGRREEGKEGRRDVVAASPATVTAISSISSTLVLSLLHRHLPLCPRNMVP